MIQRQYGSTGIQLPILGFGAGLIGDSAMDENYVGYFINLIIDLGITFIDTARGYGLSEERIGRHLSWRRKDFILSTKVGYSIPGYQDWTYDCIVAGVHHALKQMKTDYIDIVHLHSCPIETLERGEVIDALQKMVQEGHVRIAAYSGENEALDFALAAGRFGGLMSSVNVFDQRSVDLAVAPAFRQGIGYIAKRPIGNAPWLHETQPVGNYCEEYWKRMKEMQIDYGHAWLDVALRFTAFMPGISCSIVGTTNLDHMKKNISIVNKGPLPDETVQKIRSAFQHYGASWNGQV
ncbi:MAG: aldo/keto reductase [Bacteroidota bacterium]|jgi:aryl-alcohol dehydrogenase-like predicted oxidoreductase